MANTKQTKENYQDNDQWFVPGWFEPVTEKDIRDAKTLCNIIAGNQSKIEMI